MQARDRGPCPFAEQATRGLALAAGGADLGVGNLVGEQGEDRPGKNQEMMGTTLARLAAQLEG